MDEKKLEQEYKKLKQQDAPDLWSRIELNLAEHPEREENAESEAKPNVAEKVEPEAQPKVAANPEPEAAQKIRRIPRWKNYYGVAAAAAVIVVSLAVNRQMDGRSKSMDMMIAETTMAGASMEETMAEAPENAEAWDDAGMMMGAAEAEAAEAEAAGAEAAGAEAAPVPEMEPEERALMGGGSNGSADGSANGSFAGVTPFDAKMESAVSGVVYYDNLQLAAYQPVAVPENAVTVPEDTEYFSEAILGDTGLLCGGTVKSVELEYNESGKAVKVVYEVTLDKVYYSEDYTAGMDTLTVKSPIVETEGDEAYVLYQLQEGGTYLLPLEKRDGVWELLYPFAPQIQVTGDGAYLFHSGYASLVSGDTSVVVGNQESANDYYYDRMLLRKDDNFLSDFISLVEREAQGRK